MSVALVEVDREQQIDGLTFEQYCNDPDRVRAEAEAAGVKGEAYKHHFMTRGKFNGRTEIRYKPLNNLDLYNFAKSKYRKS